MITFLSVLACADNGRRKDVAERVQGNIQVNDETRGLALFNITLTQRLFGLLIAKGVISQADADLILDDVLAALEALPPAQPGAESARKIAEDYTHLIRQSRTAQRPSP